MSQRPVQGAVGPAGASGQGSSAAPQPPDLARLTPGQPEGASGDGGSPASGSASDFGRFDWFADPASFGIPTDGTERPRRSWRRRRNGSRPSGEPGSAGRPGSRRWLLIGAVLVLALACTAIGGVIGGEIAARTAGSQVDPTYSLGSLPRTVTSSPAGSVAGIAARDTPGVVMIKVNDGQGTGSGFVIKGGYIITDNHVVTVDGLVSNASLRVYFTDGRSAAARLVGRDPYSDIAVIRPVGVSGLRALTLGDSGAVAVGDPVIAIGSPLGLADTVTSGIVSAVNRPVQPAAASGATPQVYFDAIQTDAPINPGNSGGPLVNGRGQVIGIDAAIDTLGTDPITGSQGGSIGLGFAIPMSQARRVIVQLIRTGHATHSVLGATLNGTYAGNGAQISTVNSAKLPAVVPGGPAARAGLRPGDVVTWLGSQPIANAYSLLDAVRSRPPDSRVSITYLQHGQVRRAELTLGSAGS